MSSRVIGPKSGSESLEEEEEEEAGSSSSSVSRASISGRFSGRRGSSNTMRSSQRVWRVRGETSRSGSLTFLREIHTPFTCRVWRDGKIAKTHSTCSGRTHDVPCFNAPSPSIRTYLTYAANPSSLRDRPLRDMDDPMDWLSAVRLRVGLDWRMRGGGVGRRGASGGRGGCRCGGWGGRCGGRCGRCGGRCGG